MDEKLIELENELIMKYPARLQKFTVDKRQFNYDPYKEELTFYIKPMRNNNNFIRFIVKMADTKNYDVRCPVRVIKTKKIKDIIKLIDYVIENS